MTSLGEWKEEAEFPLRRFIVPCVLVGGLACGCNTSREVSSTPQVRKDAVLITKQPVVYASHTFDRTAPPADMPPLGTGETAECDANFLARSSVRGQPRRTDASHATITITQVIVTLQLEINVWLPTDATRIVADHEEGHRQIAESYYQTADKLAERIAATYIGKRVEVSGTDLDAESSKMLLQVATEITNEYTKQIDSNATQLLYDDITDHARNGVVAKDAVDHALKNAAVEAVPLVRLRRLSRLCLSTKECEDQQYALTENSGGFSPIISVQQNDKKLHFHEQKNPERINFQGLSLLFAIGLLPSKRSCGHFYFTGMLSNFPDASS